MLPMRISRLLGVQGQTRLTNAIYVVSLGIRSILPTEKKFLPVASRVAATAVFTYTLANFSAEGQEYIMTLKDVDALRKPIYAEDDNATGQGMSYAEMDGYNAGIDEVWNALQNLPVADAVPVVRCKDCQFWQRHTQVNRDYGKCERFGTVTTRCNDFCSLGIKKSEE